MKSLLFPMLSIFLLTGCDNFKLLGSKKDHQEHQFEHSDKAPPAPSGRGAQTDSNQKVPPPTETKPDINPSANRETGSSQVEPISQPPQKPATVVTLPPAPTAPSPTPAPSPAPKATPAPVAPVAVQTPQPPVAAPAKSGTPAAPVATQEASKIITLADYINLHAVLNHILGAEAKPVLLATTLPNGVQQSDIKTVHSGSVDKFNFSIKSKDKVLVGFKDLKLSINELNSSTTDKYEFAALCIGAKCELLFITVFQFDDKKKLTENYPTFLKLVNGEFVTAVFKKKEEYAADQAALKNSKENIKYVPQVQMLKNLDTFITTKGEQAIGLLQAELQKGEQIAYSDLVIGNNTMRSSKLDPRFSRENGLLVLNAQLEFTSPKKPLDFKIEVAASGPSKMAITEIELGLQTITLIKDQIIMLVFAQNNFKSKIANVSVGLQALICSLVEEEKIQFSTCIPIESSVVLNDKDAIEGNIKEKIKAGK